MSAYTGVTVETLDRQVFDAGYLVLNYGLPGQRKLGATAGGNEFTVEQEIKDIEFDGFHGPIKGGKRLIKKVAKLTVNLKELTAENFKLALAAAEVDTYSSTTHDIVKGKQTIDFSDYYDNLALIAQQSGSDQDVIIIVENVLSTEGLKLAFKDKDELVVPVTLMAHYDLFDPDKDPYQIRYPKGV